MWLFTLQMLAICHSEPVDATVYYEDGECVYWVWDDESEKRNPCGKDDEYVPESAKLAEEEQEK